MLRKQYLSAYIWISSLISDLWDIWRENMLEGIGGCVLPRPGERKFEAQSSSILSNRARSSAVWLGCFQPSLGKDFLLPVHFPVLELHFISNLLMFLFLENVNRLIIKGCFLLYIDRLAFWSICFNLIWVDLSEHLQDSFHLSVNWKFQFLNLQGWENNHGPPSAYQGSQICGSCE